MGENGKHTAALGIVRTVAYAGLFAALCFLFWQQASGVYPSDLPAHIKPPADDTYSALRILYQALLGAFGLAGVCAFLACVCVATVAVTEYLVRRLAPAVKPGAAFAAALACNFAIAVYLPFIHSYYTVGSPGGNCWHNSTYLVMRLCALAALVFYFKFDGRFPTRSKAASWCGFAALLTVATSVKPSFVMVFGPAIFALCVIDLVRQGRDTVKRSLLIGLALVVALVVVLYQMTILFPSDGSAEGGIAFGLAKVWRARHANIFVSFFQSLLFPMLVVLVTRTRFWHDRAFLLAWLTTFFAFAEYVFLYETGARTYHGNFGWGLSMAIFFLFVVAAAVFLQQRGAFFGLARASSAERDRDAGQIADAGPTGTGTSQGQVTGQVPSKAPIAVSARTGASEDQAPDQIAGAKANSNSIDTTGLGPFSLPVSKGTRSAYDYIALAAFALHTASGVWYFARLMMGASFY